MKEPKVSTIPIKCYFFVNSFLIKRSVCHSRLKNQFLLNFMEALIAVIEFLPKKAYKFHGFSLLGQLKKV